MKRVHRHSIVSGFTLLEILVVVGIIMLLAALLFPVFSRARENGKRTSCMNNLKQIALASMQYLQDHDRRFPPKPVPPADDGTNGWALDLASIAKSDAIFQCPSEGSPAADGFTDYWMNSELSGISEVRVRMPANVILFGDGVPYAVDYDLGPSAFDNWSPDSTYATRHLGGANYAFADGHIKWLNPGQVSTTEDPNGSNFTFVPG